MYAYTEDEDNVRLAMYKAGISLFDEQILSEK